MRRKNLLCILPIMSLIISVAVIDSTVSSPTTTVSVDPPSIVDTTLVPGETFTVDIVVTDVVDMYGYDFKLGYNTSILTATAYSFTGNILEPGYQIWKNEIDDGLGRVWLALTQELGAPGGVDGSGLLATITFTVDALGESDLDLYDVDLRDTLADPIPHTVTDGDFANTAPILWTHHKTKNPYPDWSLGNVGEPQTLYAPIRNTGTRGAWVTAQFIVRQDATQDTVSMDSVETWVEAGDVVTLSTDTFTFTVAGNYHFSVVAWFRPLDGMPPEPYYLHQDTLGGLGIAKFIINKINVKP